MDIQLKFDKEFEHLFSEVVRRTWVNRDKFKKFELEYQNSQDERSLTNTLDVEFKIHIKMKDISKNVEKTEKCGFRVRPCMAVSAVSNCLLNII